MARILLGNKRVTAGVGLFLMACSLYVATPHAQAIGTTGPDPNDFSPTTRRVELVVSRTADVNNSTSLVKMYFNSSSGSFRIEDYRLCMDSPGTSGNYYDVDGGAAAGSNATRYDVYNSDHSYSGNVETETLGPLITSRNGTASTANDCKDQSTTFSVSGLSYSQDAGKYVAYLRATNLIAGTQNSFRVVVTTNGYAIGYDSTIAASQFGINQVDPLSGYTDYLLKFAGDCSLTSARTEELQWYDDDNGVAGIQPTPMRFQLRKYPVSGGSYTLQPFTSIRKTNGDSISWSQSGGWYTAYSGSRSTVAARFTAEPGYRYIWYWDNVYYNNTLQFKLAFDSIFFNTGCQRPADYNLTPSISMRVNGTAATGGAVAEVGDVVNFDYRVFNNGNDDSDNTGCDIFARNHAGYYNPGGTPDTSTESGYTPPPPSPGCPRDFPGKQTTQLVPGGENYTVKASDTNKTVCRTLRIDPYSATASGSRSAIVCFLVVAKPYVKVFGGDTAAGSGIGSSCLSNPDGSITAWNKDTGTYPGAGSQFGVFALDRIHNYASAQHSAGPNKPSGLSFANKNVTMGGGIYGGSFGSLPCIPDYFSAKPGDAQALPLTPTISNLGTGHFAAGSDVTPASVTIAGGTINPNQRSVLYVQGDVYITGNIIYPGGWDRNSMPLFELIVKGNIYVAPGVTQLDGAYIAQENATGTGVIYTCATSAAPLTPDNTLHSKCKGNKLTVNGLLSAPQIMLLRTFGTLANSDIGNGSANAAEVINYNPTMWIAQPPASSSTNNSKAGKYDAVTSLPPIL